MDSDMEKRIDFLEKQHNSMWFKMRAMNASIEVLTRHNTLLQTEIETLKWTQQMEKIENDYPRNKENVLDPVFTNEATKNFYGK